MYFRILAASAIISENRAMSLKIQNHKMAVRVAIQFMVAPFEIMPIDGDLEFIKKNNASIHYLNDIKFIGWLERIASKKCPGFSIEEDHYDFTDTEVINTQVNEVMFRLPRMIYFKYFWLFYIVCLDFWDKYPKLISFEIPNYEKDKGHTDKDKYRSYLKNLLNEALITASKNFPEYAEAMKLREAKIAIGEYWPELQVVADEITKVNRTKLFIEDLTRIRKSYFDIFSKKR